MHLKASDPLAKGAKLTVDGIEVRNGIEASEEEGWATFLLSDDSGDIVRDGERAATYTLRGHVRLTFPFDAP